MKVAIDKYVDHLPLSRQARIMKRHGLQLTSQTLWDQLWALSQLLRPCYDNVRCALRCSDSTKRAGLEKVRRVRAHHR